MRYAPLLFLFAAPSLLHAILRLRAYVRTFVGVLPSHGVVTMRGGGRTWHESTQASTVQVWIKSLQLSKAKRGMNLFGLQSNVSCIDSNMIKCFHSTTIITDVQKFFKVKLFKVKLYLSSFFSLGLKKAVASPLIIKQPQNTWRPQRKKELSQTTLM